MKIHHPPDRELGALIIFFSINKKNLSSFPRYGVLNLRIKVIKDGNPQNKLNNCTNIIYGSYAWWVAIKGWWGASFG